MGRAKKGRSGYGECISAHRSTSCVIWTRGDRKESEWFHLNYNGANSCDWARVGDVWHNPCCTLALHANAVSIGPSGSCGEQSMDMQAELNIA